VCTVLEQRSTLSARLVAVSVGANSVPVETDTWEGGVALDLTRGRVGLRLFEHVGGWGCICADTW
jgi:hypothetical protein